MSEDSTNQLLLAMKQAATQTSSLLKTLGNPD